MNNVENLRDTIIPKSDQLNADDLSGTTMTITVTDVRRGSADQPVSIHYEGENGRPYKPCKSMRRVLIYLWGDDGKGWIGRSMTLYQDPEVKFGGVKVGGIRISHVSHITSPCEIALTATRGKRTPHRVQPISAASAPRSGATTAAQGGAQGAAHPDVVNRMIAAFEKIGVTQAMIEARIKQHMNSVPNHVITSLREIYDSLRAGKSHVSIEFPAPVTPGAAVRAPSEAPPYEDDPAGMFG